MTEYLPEEKEEEEATFIVSSFKILRVWVRRVRLEREIHQGSRVVVRKLRARCLGCTAARCMATDKSPHELRDRVQV